MIDRVDTETFRWVTSGLLGLISTIGGYWLTNLTTRLDSVSKDFYERGQRIAALETHVEVVNRQLARMEGKIDYLIEDKRKQ